MKQPLGLVYTCDENENDKLAVYTYNSDFSSARDVLIETHSYGAITGGVILPRDEVIKLYNQLHEFLWPSKKTTGS